MMRKFFATIAASIFFYAAIGQKSGLTLNLEQGKEYKNIADSKAIITQEFNGQKIEMTLSLYGEMSFVVKGVNPDGYDMDVRYDKIGFSMEMPQGKMDFSSDKSDANDIFSSILKAMTGKPFNLKMARNGKISSVGNVEALWGGVIDNFDGVPEAQKQQIKAQIMNAYGEKAFKGNIEMSTAIFPDKPVRKGDEWTVKTKLESGMAADMTTKYSLVDITPDYKLLKGVSVIETVDKESYVKSNGRPVKYNLKGSMISDIKIDPITGWTIEAKISQDIRGDVFMKENEEAKDEIKIPMVMINNMTIANGQK